MPGTDIQKRMFEIEHALGLFETPEGLAEMELSGTPIGLADLHQALSRATSHIPQRQVRHDHFFALLTAMEGDWRNRWKR